MRNALAASAVLLVSGGGICALGVYLYSKGLSWSGQFSGVLGLFVALIALLIPFLGKALGSLRPVRSIATAASIDGLADDLALSVLGQLNDQEHAREINDPWPLPVQWKLTKRPPTGSQTVAQPFQHSFKNGSFDKIGELFCSQISSHRLVILGGAGAGKSVLACRLARQLLERRSPGEPVPVLISVAGWDPNDESLPEFAASQLARQQPRLANEVSISATERATLARYLVSTGRVMLMLDGFDEIAEESRVKALSRISKWGSDKSVVLTSRTKEYWSAVALGREITGAEIVELQPLGLRAAKRYLAEGTPNNPVDRWANVFRLIDEDPEGPLAQVLRTPLMIWLARKIYDSDRNRPDKLADLPKDGDRSIREVIEEHLVGELVSAEYNSRNGNFRLSPERAEKYLRFLARHLRQERDTENFAWWDLNRRVPRIYYALNGGMPIGAPIGIVVLIVVGIRAGFVPGVKYAVGAGIVVSLLAGIPGSPSSWRKIMPSAIAIRDPESSGVSRKMGLGIAVGLTFGVVAGLPTGLVYGPLYGLLVGLGIGPAIGLALSVRQLFDVNADIRHAPSPASVLRDDRRSALTQASVAGIGLGIGAAIAIVITLPLGTTAGVSIGIGYALAYGAAIGLGIRGSHLTTPAFSTYFWGQVWLAATGRLPLRLMAFLEDAHQRGILRQQGAVYQFCHVSLRNYLSATSD